MSKAANYKLDVAITASDKASPVLKRVDRSLQGTGSALDKVQGKWRMSAVFGALEKLNDKTAALGRFALSAGTKLAAMGSVAGVALGAVVQRVTSAGDKTLKFSRQIGLNVERLQEWRYAAEQAGIPAEAFDKALAKLGTRSTQAFANEGEARQYFKVLGISVSDAAGKVRDLEELFLEVADKVAALPNRNREPFLIKFFDDEGVAMERMLGSGSAGLAEMAKQARELGAVASAETLGGFEEFQGKLGEVSAQIKGLTTSIVDSLMPAAQRVSVLFSEWLEGSRDTLGTLTEGLRTHLPAAIERTGEIGGRALGALHATLTEGWPVLQSWVRSFRDLGGILGDMISAASRFADFSLDVLGVPNPALQRSRAREAEIAQIRHDVISGASRAGLAQLEEQVFAIQAAQAAGTGASLLVRFAGAPAGTRVEADRAARRIVDLEVGYAMPGVGR